MNTNVPYMLRAVCACVVLVVCVAIAPLGSTQGGAPAKAQPTAQAPVARPQPAAKRVPLQITVVKIKPDMLDQWLDFQKNETIPMLKKAGIKSRDAWQTAVFGEGFMYGFVTPIDTFTQYDGDGPAVRALGADGARSYGERNRRFIESTRTYFEQSRPDLSYDVKMTAPPKLALLSSIQMVPGKAAEFEAFVKSDVVPVMRKARLGYAVSQTILGGDINGFTSLIFYDSFAEIGKGHPFQRVLGIEGERLLNEKAAAFVARVERSVLRYVPELSFTSQPTT